MQSYSVICVSTENENTFSDLDKRKIEKNENNIKLDFSSVRKLDFTHALINNGNREYKLERKERVPEFNEIKNAWTLSHAYFRHDEKETDGFQNTEATILLMIKSLSCAEKQKIDVKHCQSVEILLPEKNDINKSKKVRIISLAVKKSKNGTYEDKTKAVMTSFFFYN